MTVPISPVNNFETSINIPGPGEGVTSAAIALGVQANADRSENNNSRLNDIPQVNTVTNYSLPLTSFKTDDADDGWALSSQTANVVATTAFQRSATWSIQVPKPGVTIDSFKVYTSNDTGRGGVPAPADMPVIYLVQLSNVDNTLFIVTQVTDPSLTLAAYEADHTIEATGIGHAIVANQRYSILATSEKGANAAADKFGINAIEIGWTYP
ncbi:MAG: hypothetical protein KAJ55_12065 [Anaerolineales bacterium]|nr:hypothetical protein [Anaerolineales bacterium]